MKLPLRFAAVHGASARLAVSSFLMSRNSLTIWCVLIFFLCFRLVVASFFPIINDEAYYWDWSRTLQLSYIDAPPFVAWLAYLGSQFFSGALGARFLLPFLHLFSVLFLLLSLKLLLTKKTMHLALTRRDDMVFNVKHALALCLLTECIPYFTLEGFLLLPDASLIFATSGCLYFILKSAISYRQKFFEKSLCFGALFGFFLGLGFLAKYQIAPLGLGFFSAFLICTGISDWKFQFKYWGLVAFVFLIVSSPVLIWNAQNDWASFRFQTQHGFQGFQFHFLPLSRYFLGVILFLFPWYFYLFWKSIFICLKQMMSFRGSPMPSRGLTTGSSPSSKLELFCILPFLFLFMVIFVSALGKQALPHWAMPGFFLLVPILAKNFFLLTNQHKRLWLSFHMMSVVFAISLPLLACLSFSQTLALYVVNYFHIRAGDLQEISLWPQMQKLLQEQHSIDIATFPYSESQLSHCPNNTPYLASLRWYWTAQMAFHFNQQSRVFNFGSSRSYYSWRDNHREFSGCRFIVVGSQSHFNQSNLEKIMTLDSVQHIVLEPYAQTKIVVVRGALK